MQVKSKERIKFIEVTGQVLNKIKATGIVEGMCHLFVPHTTAAITVNENADPDVMRDIHKKMLSLIPAQENYLHSEGNSDAHIKASLFGCSLAIPVAEGALKLGTWQGIYFCEFDGPRQRQLNICLIGTDIHGTVKIW